MKRDSFRFESLSREPGPAGNPSSSTKGTGGSRYAFLFPGFATIL